MATDLGAKRPPIRLAAQSPPWTAARVWQLAWIFTREQAVSCLFATLIFAGIAVTAVLDLPIARYDALLIYGVILTIALWVAKWETTREVAVITGFHLLGLALEIFKVHLGSWEYPDEGVAKVGDVPLYAGFMYAAVGSYLCQAWRRFDFRVTEYRPQLVTSIAVLLYVNFFTHHFFVDVRWLLAFVLLVVLGRTRIHFTVGVERFHIPLAVGFVLVGAVVWLAENAGTFLGAWQYPNQADVWQIVHVGRMGSWALLVSLSFALIATIKSTERRLYGKRSDHASVEARRHIASEREHP